MSKDKEAPREPRTPNGDDNRICVTLREYQIAQLFWPILSNDPIDIDYKEKAQVLAINKAYLLINLNSLATKGILRKTGEGRLHNKWARGLSKFWFGNKNKPDELREVDLNAPTQEPPESPANEPPPEGNQINVLLGLMDLEIERLEQRCGEIQHQIEVLGEARAILAKPL